MLEKEYKYMLSHAQYEKLVKLTAEKYSTNTFVQINYYFDTSTYELNKNDYTLRIRQLENELKLQLKCPILRDKALSIKDEISIPINEFPLSIKCSQLNLHKVIPVENDMYMIGILVTERIICNVSDNIELCIDKNYYLGVTDFELEVEFKEEGKEESIRIIDGLGIEIEESMLGGKRNRFFDALLKIKQQMFL